MLCFPWKICICFLTLLMGEISSNYIEGAIALRPIYFNLKNSMIQEIVVRQAKAWENADAETIVADFAENGIFVVSESTFSGREAIKAAVTEYFDQFQSTKVKIIQIIVEGDRGTVEWTWRDINKTTKEEAYAEDAIILELRDGKIVYWREYIDKKSA